MTAKNLRQLNLITEFNTFFIAIAFFSCLIKNDELHWRAKYLRLRSQIYDYCIRFHYQRESKSNKVAIKLLLLMTFRALKNIYTEMSMIWQMEMKIDGNHCKLPNDDYWRQSKTINHHHNNQLDNFLVNWNPEDGNTATEFIASEHCNTSSIYHHYTDCGSPWELFLARLILTVSKLIAR